MEVEIYAAVETRRSKRGWGCAMRPFLHGPRLASILAASKRGLPPDFSPKSLAEDPFYVDDELAGLDAPRTCTVADADEWISTGRSFRLDPDRVSDPEVHSHTWLTTAELGAVASEYRAAGGEGAAVDLAAVIAYMQAQEAGGCEARIVVYFEN